MKTLKVLFVLSLAISLWMMSACKQNNSTSSSAVGEDMNTENAGSPSKVSNSGKITAEEIAKILPRAQAKGKEKNDKSWAILTADMWEYDFAITPEGSPKKNIFEGEWIDFKDDYSYLKGTYQDTTEAGYYVFDFDHDKQLEIIPLIGGESASSWRLLTNGEVTIMIGTDKFGKRGWQVKIVRTHRKPVKSNK